MNIQEITGPGVLVAVAFYVFKTSFDMVASSKNKNGGKCTMSEEGNILVKRTHDIALETKDLTMDTNRKLDAHFTEVGNIAKSIQDLAESIKACRTEDTRTQQTQTKILETLSQVIANQ